MSTLTFGMGLILPTIGVDSGLIWEQSMNTNSNTINNHDHSLGHGTQINSTGINLTSDLSFNSVNAISLRTTRFTPQGAVLTLPTDLNCCYFVGLEFYINDGAGNNIKVTQGGNVLASSSGISSGSAVASFVGSVLTVLSAANTPADIQAASYIMGNAGTSGGSFLTLQPPNPVASNYNITLPNLPASTAALIIDSSGNMSASVIEYQAFNPTGSVIAFAGVAQPAGWLFCNGAAVSQTTYATLFAAIGFTYGNPGGGNFNVPNLINSAPFGIGDRFTIGQTGGYLDPNINTLAIHTHAVTDPTHGHTANQHNHSDGTGGQFLSTNGSPLIFSGLGVGTPLQMSNNSATGLASDTTVQNSLTGITIDTNGTSSTNGNMPPFVGMNYIIKT